MSGERAPPVAPRNGDSHLKTSPWKPTSTVRRLMSGADREQHKDCRAMTSRLTSEAALIPLFLGRERCNVTFVVGSSESMTAVLGSVKLLLIQTLQKKATLRDCLFNIITFSDEVTCWSHYMLPCVPETVYMAFSWIHSIHCSPGRDLLAAVGTALADPACHAVHLICSDPPDHPEAVMKVLPSMAAGRPLNTFYLHDSGGQLESATQDYLKCLTQATRGRCYLVPVGLNGALEKETMTFDACGQVIPLCELEKQSPVPTNPSVKHCCPCTPVLIPPNTPPPLLRSSLGILPCPCTPSDQIPSPVVFPGCRVLARREVDGFYYMGTVVQPVQGHGGVWVVEFDRPEGAGLEAVFSLRQLVCSLNMVKHTRTHTCCLVPGDAVLSPWEPDLKRFGPGRVMAAIDHKETFRAEGAVCLRVLMWNGCVSLVPGSLVFPVPDAHYDRTVRELQILASASSCCWTGLSAHISTCTPPQMFYSDWCQPSSLCCSAPNQWLHSPPTSCRSSCGVMGGFERTEQDGDVRKRDANGPFSSSSTSSSASSLSLFEDESRTWLPPAVRLRRKEKRPPWRYWRRSGPEPQHRQPGTAMPRRTSQPVKINVPVSHTGASPNHSSLFQSLSSTEGKRRSTNIFWNNKPQT